MKKRSIELTQEDIEKRGLIRDGKGFPYNKDNNEKAQSLRKNMTKAERKIWFQFLQDHKYKFYKQRCIDHFIADFYCAKASLIIEIDGETHHTKNGIEYDKMRTDILNLYGLHIIRYTNKEVLENFEEVCENINSFLEKNTLPTLPSREDSPLKTV